MAKVNFKQQKRQRENARKQRQTERLSRRGEKPAGDEAAALAGGAVPATETETETATETEGETPATAAQPASAAT